ncbi:MAG: hypothetical protein IPN90_13660 [Elusimicrobia bacterium]|nr:hypothetical protein [Elusimicrobiota bacterium]
MLLLFLALGTICGLLPANLSADVTMDQVQEEVHRQLEAAETAKQKEPPQSIDQSKIDFKSGNGIPLVRSPNGELKMNLYLLVRYLNQLPATQSFEDHFGNTRNIDTANYISAPHRVILNFNGWLYDPRFLYQTAVWTVNSTDKVAIIGSLGWVFNKAATLNVGIGALPGTRTMTYSHPYWVGTDRLMADEFFRPGFTQGAWLSGEAAPGLKYTVMLGNNLTTLNVNAKEDTRDFVASGNLAWMPTTHEFGPKGGMGDFEQHEKLATRIGTAYTQGRQNAAQSTSGSNQPDSTQIRMADSLLPFTPGAVVAGYTVDILKYQMWAVDAGLKYKGFHLQGEAYLRQLSDFYEATDVRVPQNMVTDTGFYVQASKMIRPRKTEAYVASSVVFGDKSAGYRSSYDFIQGLNFFLFDTRNSRINVHVIEVYRAPTSSDFGYYVGGQKGVTVSVGWSINF